MHILRVSAQLVFFCAVAEQRFVFSVRVEDVQLGHLMPPVTPGRQSPPARVWDGVRAAAGAFRNSLITVTWPSACRVCDAPLVAWARTPVCTQCIAAVMPESAPLCAVCGCAVDWDSMSMARGRGAATCAACHAAPPAYVRAESYARYEDEVREMTHLVKFGGMPQLVEFELAGWMAEVVLRFRDDAPEGLTLIAVPLHARRLRSRGFNQSVLLADAAIARLRRAAPQWRLESAHGALRRVRETREMYSLAPRIRRQALRDAFCVARRKDVQGRDVLLVDDIMTTGATARECARTLIEAGARRVFVATLTRAQEAHLTAEWEPSQRAEFS